MPDIAIPDRLRLPLAFDADALSGDLDRLEGEAWTRHFVASNYDGEWEVLPLRAPAGETHPIRMIYSDPAATRFADTPLRAALPAFDAALGRLRCPLRSARLLRLGPGSVIKPHADVDLAYEDGTVRLHVPVRTSEAVDFRLNGTRVVMAPGTCWYLRLSDMHSVENRGATARVHLVVDAHVDDWLRDLFRQALEARTAAAPIRA